MAETLELTFTGLCVMVVTGAVGEVHPSKVEILMVDESGGHHLHLPQMSFRGLDLGDVSSGEGDEVSLDVMPDGQEIINLPILSNSVEVFWESGAMDTQYTMAWDASPISMLKVPDLLDFNVTEVHRDGTNTAATVTLPFGRFEARRIVRDRASELLWAFPGLPGTRVYANQVTLVSQATQGKVLNIRSAGKLYSFLSGDGEQPLRISLTNLPPKGRLVEPPIGENQSPPHLSSYRKIAKTETGTGFRVFTRSLGATRQGSICPTVRAHV